MAESHSGREAECQSGSSSVVVVVIVVVVGAVVVVVVVAATSDQAAAQLRGLEQAWGATSVARGPNQALFEQ